jgi:hypothetical protein
MIGYSAGKIVWVFKITYQICAVAYIAHHNRVFYWLICSFRFKSFQNDANFKLLIFEELSCFDMSG